MTLINISLVVANQMQFLILYKISLHVINNINNILKSNIGEMFFYRVWSDTRVFRVFGQRNVDILSIYYHFLFEWVLIDVAVGSSSYVQCTDQMTISFVCESCSNSTSGIVYIETMLSRSSSVLSDSWLYEIFF